MGFVVSKKVGNAVERNRVKRPLRPLSGGFDPPPRADVVVRPPRDALAQRDGLADDLASAWRRATARAAA